MKTILKSYLINTFSLYITSLYIPGLKIASDWQIIFTAGAVLTFIYFFLKPIVSLFFKPLNFLTLGFFSFLINGALLYSATIFVPQFKIVPWHFPGFNSQGFIIPPVNLSFWQVAILSAFIISLISNFFHWLCH